MAYNVITKSKRAPTVAAPGAKGKTRPTGQKGGGGNKAAGSPEPTASTTPTVTVSSNGTVTAEHFGAGASAQKAAQAAVRTQRQQARKVKRIVALVNSKPKTSAPVAKGTEPKAPKPSSKPPTFEGKKTAGTPTLASLEKSSDKGTLKTNKAGFLTTPQIRQAVQKVDRARVKVAKTTGVTGPLTRSQKKIARQVSKETGLKPKTVATQELQEQSGEHAQQREAEKNFNTLDIGYFDSGAGRLTKDPTWSNPKSAAKATSEFFKGERYGPSSSIASILPKAKGKSVAKQLAVIGNSDWATSNYGPDLAATSKLVGEKSNPKAEAQLQAAVKKAKSLGLKVGKAAGDVSAEPGTHTVKVRADAQGMVKWAESVQGTKESTPRQLRWASNEGLGAGEPWCANFVSNGLLRRGIKNLPSNPNYVPSYESDWGGYSIGTTDLSKAKPGDLITFSGEHIGLYVGNGEMISGNFGDEVSRDPVSADSTAVSMILRPPYKGGYIKVKETTSLPGSTNPTGSVASSSAPAGVSAVAAPSNPKKKGKTKARLSAPQVVAQAERKLAAGDLKAGSETPTTSILDALAKKYGA